MLMDEDVDAAEIITFEYITVTTKSGKRKTRKVTVALDLPPRASHGSVDVKRSLLVKRSLSPRVTLSLP